MAQSKAMWICRRRSPSVSAPCWCSVWMWRCSMPPPCGASAVMTAQDRQQLEGLLTAVERQQQTAMTTRVEQESSLAPSFADAHVEAKEAQRPFVEAILSPR